MERKGYPSEFRRPALAQVAQGRSVAEIERLLGRCDSRSR